MAPAGDRAAQFPAIEKKHGKPITHWLKQVEKLGDAKYADQLDLLMSKHGFSRAHANAVVMYARGSTSTRKFDDPESFLKAIGGEREATARAILRAIAKKFPELELVVAWNQPMFKIGKHYVFGLSAATNHLTIAPWGGISDEVRSLLKGLVANKKTVQVPIGWKPDVGLLTAMISERLAQIEDSNS
jgi:uncharacterized protein YdhG (YjbR/CyaY superfamily)